MSCHVRDRTLLMLGFVLMALGSAVLALYPTSSGIIYTTPIFSLALSLLRSSPAAYLSKHSPPEMQGEAMGHLNAGSSLCRVVAPVLSGILADHQGHAAPFWVCAGLCMAGILCLLVYSRFEDAEIAEEMKAESQDSKKDK
mmetsp:Transcript_7880/g.12527  ORF Transcript_7880/g.12527 Transcript_7880/m.12527 type:complete len:141 (+) Transcript_7880:148-570(+)